MTDVEIVRRLWLGYLARGLEGVFEWAWEDGYWRSALANFREVRGRPAIERLFAQLAQNGITVTALPYDFEQAGADVVLSTDLLLGIGGEERLEQLAMRFCLRDGKVSAVVTYLTREQAIEAAREG